MQTNLDYQSLL